MVGSYWVGKNADGSRLRCFLLKTEKYQVERVELRVSSGQTLPDNECEATREEEKIKKEGARRRRSRRERDRRERDKEERWEEGDWTGHSLTLFLTQIYYTGLCAA
jgi:hypothetical protein